MWYKDGNHLQGSKNHHVINQVKVADSGSYKCEVKRGKDKIIQYKSQAVKIEVHGVFCLNSLTSFISSVVKLSTRLYNFFYYYFAAERPLASVILLTGWTEVFSTDILVLKCEVEDSLYQWNYTW